MFLKFLNILLKYPTPYNLSYAWNFGSMAFLALLIQLITGFLLIFSYLPTVDLAFQSVDFLTREISFGWLVRFCHINGASLFFIVVYLHILRNLIFSSFLYPRDLVWYSGIILFLLLILTSFFGYVLPWGQMSYWAATVITSLLSVIPFFGDNLLICVWGGVSVNQITLSRFYGLHFLFPFILLILSLLHVLLLHRVGSSNPLGLTAFDIDFVPFHPYFTYKDLYSFMWVFIFYFVFVFFKPYYTTHSDNFMVSDSTATPLHIVPEWYFLPFYAILRSVPSKLGGVLLLLMSIFVLFLLPLLTTPLTQSVYFKSTFMYAAISTFILIFFLLIWVGAKPIEYPYYSCCQILTISYFTWFLYIYDYLDRIELDFYNEVI